MKSTTTCLLLLMSFTRQSSAFLLRTNVNTHQGIFQPITLASANSFEQLPGESDIDFIQRITNQSKTLLDESSNMEKQKEREEEEQQKSQRESINVLKIGMRNETQKGKCLGKSVCNLKVNVLAIKCDKTIFFFGICIMPLAGFAP